jgi:cardiolipin synthase
MELQSLWLILILCLHLLGIAHAAIAIVFVRTSQAAIAWAICLVLFPYISLPLFWAFGPRRFYSYRKKIAEAHKDFERHFQQQPSEKAQNVYEPALPEGFQDDRKFFETLAEAKFSSGNAIEIFSNGSSYFEALFREIEEAKDYVLVQFYIVRSDEVGDALANLLIRKAREKVRVYFLYDQIGSFLLSARYLRRLESAGIQVSSFKTNKGLKNPFLLNFRNHRKIVVCDGKVAFIGGSNIGKEYRGESLYFKAWRDTDVRLLGPAIHAVQRSFARDWFWSSEQAIENLRWDTSTEAENLTCLAIHTGPLSLFDEASLLFLGLFTLAQKRVWIATPYFVPDEGIMKALELAALRGLDVRILLPKIRDNPVVSLATAYHARQISKVGVKVYQYQPGFMHQKVVLIDDMYSLVGTTNVDNRSLKTNFELSLLTVNHSFAKRIEVLLESDFGNAKLLDTQFFADENPAFVLATRFAWLFSPVL